MPLTLGLAVRLVNGISEHDLNRGLKQACMAGLTLLHSFYLSW